MPLLEHLIGVSITYIGNIMPKDPAPYYSFFSMIFVEEWFMRTVGVAFLAWVSVVILRAMIFGGNLSKAKKSRIKQRTTQYYIPLNFAWSLMMSVQYYLRKQGGDKDYMDFFHHLYWFLIFSLFAFGVHMIWVLGFAPWSDKKFGTNWLGKK